MDESLVPNRQIDLLEGENILATVGAERSMPILTGG